MCSRCDGMVVLHHSALRQIESLVELIRNDTRPHLSNEVWTKLLTVQNLLDIVKATTKSEEIVEVYD